MNITSNNINKKEDNFVSTFYFKVEIAKEYGIEAATLIQHFLYSIGHHKRNGTHFYEGRYWSYYSVSHLTKIYPFWSPRTIRRLIDHLLEKKVLITGNFNKHKYDRTRWFAFSDEEKFIPVDNSVNNSENIVDNTVDNLCIENNTQNEKQSKKNSGVEPFLSKKSSVSRSNGHLSIPANAFVDTDKPIPMCSTIYKSYSGGEGKRTGDRQNEGNLKKSSRNNAYTGPLRAFSNIIGPSFTIGYSPPYSVRIKLYELGFTDEDIDKEILNLIRYHEENPQFIKNKNSCVLGWFKKSLTWRKQNVLKRF